MRYRVLFLVVVGLLVCSFAYADVPKLVNFQGRLTDASGKFVPDGNYSVTFRLYNDSTGGSVKWSEAQLVMVSKGLFNVILGSVTPIPDSIFEYTDAFLGIQVAADPEMTPRQRLSTLGYAYYAKNSDKLDGLHAIDFTSPASDFGRYNVATDLYEGTSTLTTKYVNTTGPEQVTSSSGTAFTGSTSGSSASSMYGIQGFTVNTSTGTAYGGFFSTSSSGTGWHYGVSAQGSSSTSALAFGVDGFAVNSSTGQAYGGYFSAGTSGTGMHYGVYGNASGTSSASCLGSTGWASNSSSGSVYGGYFSTSSSGTGTHYGSYSGGQGSSSGPVYGNYSDVSNSSTGRAYGGYFLAASSGTGQHYGLRAVSYGSSDSSTYGFDAIARNGSSGNVYGGFFTAESFGTGEHYGIRAEGYSATLNRAVGTYGYAQNSSTGGAYGGLFDSDSLGTGGEHIGVVGRGFGRVNNLAIGSLGRGQNSSTGPAYGGYFWSTSNGTGTKYGVYAYLPPANGYAGYFEGKVRINDSLIVLGGKSAAVKVDNGEYRLLYSQESPENWFEDFGEGKLVNGKTVIQIDPLFVQTVNTSVKYHVFLTPQDEPLTLAVANRTANSFEVRGPAGSNISFSYRIVAKRKGYENLRLAKMGGPTPEEVTAEQSKFRTEFEKSTANMRPEKQVRPEMIETRGDDQKIREENARMEAERLRMEKEKPSMVESR